MTSAAFRIARNAASPAASGAPMKVTTVRLVDSPGSTSRSFTPGVASISLVIAWILSRSRPSLKFGTHSTSFMGGSFLVLGDGVLELAFRVEYVKCLEIRQALAENGFIAGDDEHERLAEDTLGGEIDAVAVTSMTARNTGSRILRRRSAPDVRRASGRTRRDFRSEEEN